jgi:hypothetical protein
VAQCVAGSGQNPRSRTQALHAHKRGSLPRGKRGCLGPDRREVRSSLAEPKQVGQGDQHADFAFAYGAREGPRAFVSTIKLRQAGFTKTVDTEDSFRNAL